MCVCQTQTETDRQTDCATLPLLQWEVRPTKLAKLIIYDQLIGSSKLAHFAALPKLRLSYCYSVNLSETAKEVVFITDGK